MCEGKMFPTEGNVYIAPFTDEALYLEWMGKAKFWCVLHSITSQAYWGVDLFL